MGAEVTVLSQSLSKADDAMRFGADHCYATGMADTFQALAGRFDLIICTVSAELDWNAYLSLLAIDGSLVIIGIPEKSIPLSALSLVVGRRSLSGSLMGSIKETQEMLDFCGRHDIAAEIQTIRIQDVNDAYERLEKNDVRYRFVIDIASLQD
ncbi:zinc-binding dehydrogenase family protein [Collimonas pratensis]|uniref:Zinc-binding dehydrogenase family protein n=1 Tax=Collimonas pratensis TaxID=279113 RepID=A0A127Q6R7_9BURK|nr:zinc-binding dehydrogenase family protein [Collimonas pratensis]